LTLLWLVELIEIPAAAHPCANGALNSNSPSTANIQYVIWRNRIVAIAATPLFKFTISAWDIPALVGYWLYHHKAGHAIGKSLGADTKFKVAALGSPLRRRATRQFEAARR
jgi:hypothetical protein